MKRCKNCSHGIAVHKDYPKEGEKGIIIFYTHTCPEPTGCHSDYCDCGNPEPEEMGR